MIVKMSGGTSSIELYEDYLVIKSNAMLNHTAYSQTIPLNGVVTVSIVKSFIKTSYLQIITPNLVQSKKDNLKGAEANVVLIQPGNMKKAEKIRDYVNQYKIQQSKSQQQAPSSPQPQNSLDDIKKLAELLEAGIITNEEFEAKKKQLLNI